MTPCSVSRLGTPFTRFGVYRLVERCAARVPGLAGRTITPHVIRHTTACHLVLAGVDINTVRAWLGHVSISTTNIYAEIDLTLKANAVALCDVGAVAARSLMEGGQGPHGLPEILVSRGRGAGFGHPVLAIQRPAAPGRSPARSAARTSTGRACCGRRPPSSSGPGVNPWRGNGGRPPRRRARGGAPARTRRGASRDPPRAEIMLRRRRRSLAKRPSSAGPQHNPRRNIIGLMCS